MAVFKSEPHKAIMCGRKTIKFDVNGYYETTDKAELETIKGAKDVKEVKEVKASKKKA